MFYSDHIKKQAGLWMLTETFKTIFSYSDKASYVNVGGVKPELNE
jgi:hypothetical protein